MPNSRLTQKQQVEFRAKLHYLIECIPMQDATELIERTIALENYVADQILLSAMRAGTTVTKRRDLK